MKKRIFVCCFIFAMCIFHLSNLNVVFGQQSAAELVFTTHQDTLLDREIQGLLPDVLSIFTDSEGIRESLSPTVIRLILRGPAPILRSYDEDIDKRFLELMTTHDGLRDMFADEQFYNVLKDPDEINELVERIKREKVPTTLEISSGDDQFGAPSTELKDPFVVVVKDQYDEPLISQYATNVTFQVIQITENNNGQISGQTKIIQKTNGMGRAKVTLTLGSRVGIYKVEASVEGISQRVTFTAAVTTTDGVELPTILEIVSGKNQTGEVGKPLAQPFVVRVKGENGPLGGVNVTFSVTSDGGTLWGKPSQTIATNESGEAGITLTLGSNVVNQVEASVDGIQQRLTFAAAATIAAAAIARPTPSLPVVYWIEDGKIFQFDGGRPEELIPPSNGWTATSLAVDMAGRKLYWTAKRKTGEKKGSIWEADLNSRNPEMLKEIHAAPRGIVVNAENRMLYWTTDNGRIHRFNIIRKHLEGEFITNLGSPHHIALDLKARTAYGDIYWTVKNKDGSWSIWSTSLDGTITTKEIVQGLNELGGIAVDRSKLYWTERVGDNHGKISCASKNGAGIRTLVPIDIFSLPGSIPLGLAVDEMGRRLYWTDNGGNIRSLNLDEPIKIVVRNQANNSLSNNPTGAIALGRSSEAVPASPAAPSTIVEHSEQNALLANYPNPFNPETWIPYQLSEPADVSVSIYSVNGHLVRRLDLGHQSAGVYRSRSRAAYWDGRNAFGERVASGLYFYTFTAGDFTATRKMLIRK